jgi:radical SAM superfamily enzyme YgiQ (UPF0313 family)
MKPPRLLLINPWIYDFAAYDFFARPLGLLYLAGWLEACGYEVDLLDCLDAPRVRPGPYGCGRYPKEVRPTPAGLKDAPRRFGRYGMSDAAFEGRLKHLPRPDAVLVTSLMTYWYPGVVEVVGRVRRHFPGAPVLLGGIYATLCSEHAREHAGADVVVAGPGEAAMLEYLTQLGLPPASALDPNLNFSCRQAIAPHMDNNGALNRKPTTENQQPPYPALHLMAQPRFIPALTSRGCPLNCDYCASRQLQPHFSLRPPLMVAAELIYWQDRLGLQEAAFYDDALLYQAESHLLVLLEELARQGRSFRFHTPNGLHARWVTRGVARWLKRANFAMLRLGVETTALGEARLDHKLAAGELEAALRYLQEAGFSRQELGVYLLIGLPCQEEAEVEASIRRVRQLGAAPVLAAYSPIPGTALWPQAVAAARYDLAVDPLYHNNSLFPCWPQFSWERYSRLKGLAAGGQ